MKPRLVSDPSFFSDDIRFLNWIQLFWRTKYRILSPLLIAPRKIIACYIHQRLRFRIFSRIVSAI